MAMLPLEIIQEEILPKLPVKSLLRFKCVSKKFRTLISSPNFIRRHLRHSLSSATSRLLITTGENELHSFNLDSPENPPLSIPVPEFFRYILRDSIIGCCNGLLLLRAGPYNNNMFMLINPSTGFSTVIPYAGEPACYCSYGFGYDAINDDYKIVIVEASYIVVTNLKDKVWRKVVDFHHDRLAHLPLDDGQVATVCDNHLCHYLIWCELQNKHRIVCFDLCIEYWTHDIPLPDCRDERNDVKALHVLDWFLSVLTQSNTDGDGYDVWVMKEYGIKESWVKLFGFPDPNCTPLAFGRGSNLKVLCKFHVVMRNRREFILLKWYNVREKQFYDAEIHDVHSVECLRDVWVVNGSLVTVPGGKRIRDNDQGAQAGWSIRDNNFFFFFDSVYQD